MLALISWAMKIGALLVGVLEAISKLIAGIISLKPTKKGDKLLVWVDNVASFLKKWFYDISDKTIA